MFLMAPIALQSPASELTPGLETCNSPSVPQAEQGNRLWGHQTQVQTTQNKTQHWQATRRVTAPTVAYLLKAPPHLLTQQNHHSLSSQLLLSYSPSVPVTVPKVHHQQVTHAGI